MRFVGIDVVAERHVVAVVDEADRVLLKATPFTEDADGYAKPFGGAGGAIRPRIFDVFAVAPPSATAKM